MSRHADHRATAGAWAARPLAGVCSGRRTRAPGRLLEDSCLAGHQDLAGYADQAAWLAGAVDAP